MYSHEIPGTTQQQQKELFLQLTIWILYTMPNNKFDIAWSKLTERHVTPMIRPTCYDHRVISASVTTFGTHQLTIYEHFSDSYNTVR